MSVRYTRPVLASTGPVPCLCEILRLSHVQSGVVLLLIPTLVNIMSDIKSGTSELAETGIHVCPSSKNENISYFFFFFSSWHILASNNVAGAIGFVLGCVS